MKALLFFALSFAAFPQSVIGPCTVFPANHILNTPIDKAPLHPKSSAWISFIGAGTSLHPDFGPGGGLPINVVNNIPKVTVPVEYVSDSDHVPVPFPPLVQVENGSDAHVLIVDTKDCTVYEMLSVTKVDGQYRAAQLSVWNLNSNALRPDEWTSADAAGLSMTQLVLKGHEVFDLKEVKHALRFTAPATLRNSYLWPARHYASVNNDPARPPMGMRVRLKASYDISGFSPEAKVILTGLKKYGMVLSDNGGPWYFQGTPDDRWTVPGALDTELKTVKGSDLEVVDTSSFQANANSGVAVTEEFYMPNVVVSLGNPPTNCPKPNQMWFNRNKSTLWFCVERLDHKLYWQQTTK